MPFPLLQTLARQLPMMSASLRDHTVGSTWSTTYCVQVDIQLIFQAGLKLHSRVCNIYHFYLVHILQQKYLLIHSQTP
jgi:hypothetical protein